MKTLVNKFTLLFLLLVPLCSFSQTHLKLNVALGLHPKIIFGNHVLISQLFRPDSNFTYISTDNEDIAQINNHPIFDAVSIENNREDHLIIYKYSCHSKEKTSRYKGKILNTISEYYGLPTSYNSDDRGTYWRFKSGDEYVRFNVEGNGTSELTVGTNKYIKAYEIFNKRSKQTIIDTKGHAFSHFFHGDINGQNDNSEYNARFLGVKEKQIIQLVISPLYKDVKFILIVLDNKTTIQLNINKKVRARSYYYHEFNLTRDNADLFFNSEDAYLCFDGKYPDQIDLRGVKDDFNVIYKYLYVK